MKRCRDADSYDATLPPRCDGRSACEACVAKWQAAQAERIARANAGRKRRLCRCAPSFCFDNDSSRDCKRKQPLQPKPEPDPCLETCPF